MGQEDRHLKNASYELYVPVGGARAPDANFWQDPAGPAIPGRGTKDRFSAEEEALKGKHRASWARVHDTGHAAREPRAPPTALG